MNKVFTIAAGAAVGIGAYVVLTAYDGPTYHNEVSRVIQNNCQMDRFPLKAEKQFVGLHRTGHKIRRG